MDKELLEDALYWIGNITIMILVLAYNLTAWLLLPQLCLLYAQLFRRGRN